MQLFFRRWSSLTLTSVSKTLFKACFVSVLFAGLFSNPMAFAESSPSAPEIKLTLNWKPEPQFGGFYAADFSQYKLNVQIQEGGSGTPTVQMLLSGKADYAIVSSEEILVANEKNPKTPLVALFAVYQTNPQIIMAHEERGFKTMAEVFKSEGTIGLQGGLSYALFLKKKFDPIKAHLVPYPGGITEFIAKKTHSQQGFLTSEPLLAQTQGQRTKTFLVADEGFNPYTTVLATQASRLEIKADEVKNMVKATREGWAKYLKSPDLTNEKMAKLNPAMNAETFKSSALAQKPLIEMTASQPLGHMSEQRWRDLKNQLQGLGLIKSDINVSQVYKNL